MGSLRCGVEEQGRVSRLRGCADGKGEFILRRFAHAAAPVNIGYRVEFLHWICHFFDLSVTRLGARFARGEINICLTFHFLMSLVFFGRFEVVFKLRNLSRSIQLVKLYNMPWIWPSGTL